MEKYEDIENNMPDLCDASTITAIGYKETLHQVLQRQLEGEAEIN